MPDAIDKSVHRFAPYKFTRSLQLLRQLARDRTDILRAVDICRDGCQTVKTRSNLSDRLAKRILQRPFLRQIDKQRLLLKAAHVNGPLDCRPLPPEPKCTMSVARDGHKANVDGRRVRQV